MSGVEQESAVFTRCLNKLILQCSNGVEDVDFQDKDNEKTVLRGLGLLRRKAV